MGRNKKRRINPSQSPNQGERLKVHEVSPTGSTNHLHPIFNLEHLGGAYCLSKCTQEEKAAFADKIHLLSQLTWAQISHAPRHGLGYESIPRHQLNVSTFPPELTPDVKILSFRFHGLAPMIGYRDNRVFVVLILDRDYTAYNHE